MKTSERRLQEYTDFSPELNAPFPLTLFLFYRNISAFKNTAAKETSEKLDFNTAQLTSDFERRLQDETERLQPFLILRFLCMTFVYLARIREEERAKYVELLKNYQKLSDPHGINWYFWYLCFMDVEIPSSPAWMINGSPKKQTFPTLGLKPVGTNHGAAF